MTLVLAVVAAAGAGLVLGLLGGGGSILTLPILVYLAGLPTRPAIAASLVVVAATSAVAVVPHARAGRVRWRTALPFAAAGIAGAYGGGRLADRVPGPVLLAGFGLMAALAAAVMLRPRRAGAAGTDRVGAGRDRSAGGRRARPVVAATTGGLVGLATGLVGAGGGFVIVPVLVVLGGLGMAEAVGTSLLVIAVQSAAGLAGHLPSVRLDWPVVAAVTAAAIVGSLAGARLVARVPQAALRTGFGWLVLAMAALILGQQVPVGLWGWLTAGPAGWTVLAGADLVVTGAVLVGLRCRCRRRTERHGRPVRHPRPVRRPAGPRGGASGLTACPDGANGSRRRIPHGVCWLVGGGGRSAMLLDDDARRDVLRRLHRAQGQLRGITGMVESGRDCADIVTQLAAAVRALDSAGFTIIAAGLRQGAAAPASDVDAAASMARLEKLFLSLA